MIFVTVGTQGQFNRLIRTVDEWAGLRGRTDVSAQTGPSNYAPKHIRAKPFIDATEFRKCVESANLVIAHAGMGSIITALEFRRPIIVMPRREDLGEHRNDHQVATAKYFAEQGRIMVAFNEQKLLETLDRPDVFHETERFSVEPLGANLDDPPDRGSVLGNRKPGPCRLLLVGVNWKEKGADIAIGTLAELKDMGIAAELVICGCTPPNPVTQDGLTIIPYLDKNNREQRNE